MTNRDERIPFPQEDIESYRELDDFEVQVIDEYDTGFVWTCSCGHGIGTPKDRFSVDCESCDCKLVAGDIKSPSDEQEDSESAQRQSSFLDWE